MGKGLECLVEFLFRVDLRLNVKILHVIHSVNPQGGGTAEGVRQLSAALLQEGASVDVLTLDAPDAPWIRDFPLPLFALGPGRFGYGYSPRVVPWLVQHGGAYDMILVNGLWQFGGLAVWLASRKTSLRYAVFPHGMLDPWFKRRYPLKHLKKWLYWPWAEYRVLRDAADVFFTSDEERLEARKSFPLYRCHEQVLGYGIALPPGEASQQQALFSEHYPNLAGKRLILFLGRIHEKKGIDLLLQAFHELLPAAKSDFHLIIAGPHDNPYGVRMQELTRQLGLDSHVTWPDMLSGDIKWGALRSADVFILPSHQENFGISVVEALACRLPVLISNKVNIWREITSDQAGLVENDDLAGTRHLLQRWMELPLAETELFRSHAQDCFEKRFHMATVAKKLLSIVEDLKRTG